MNLASLPQPTLKIPLGRLHEPGMVVQNEYLHAAYAAPLQTGKYIRPRALGFAIPSPQPEHLAHALLVDARDNQGTGGPDGLIASDFDHQGVHDHERVGLAP